MNKWEKITYVKIYFKKNIFLIKHISFIIAKTTLIEDRNSMKICEIVITISATHFFCWWSDFHKMEWCVNVGLRLKKSWKNINNVHCTYKKCLQRNGDPAQYYFQIWVLASVQGASRHQRVWNSPCLNHSATS